MNDISVEQAIYGSEGESGYHFLARSSGFREEWLPEAQRLCMGFGERPTGIRCPAAIFAHPLGADSVAIVQVADQGEDDAGRPGALGFRLLVLSTSAYRDLGGDPFALAGQLPPSWSERGQLPSLKCSFEPLPRRSVAQIRELLERYQAMQPTLLGGAQALVDGGRLVFERSEPDADLLRALWLLLPLAARSQIWPATFAFGNTLNFDALVVPKAQGVEYAGYLREAQAGDYPEGQYELGLQIAIESGDESGLDAALARRGHRDTKRFVLLLLVAVVLLTMALGFLTPPEPTPGTGPQSTAQKEDIPDLPPAQNYPTLDPARRQLLTTSLDALAERLGLPDPRPTDAEGLIDALDAKLGSPNPRRQPGSLKDQGPVGRRLRLLLWKHGVEEYNDDRYNPAELIERLEKRLAERKKASS